MIDLGQFAVFRQGGLRMIQALDWEDTIKEGESLQLSVLLNQSRNSARNLKELKCPQCKQNSTAVPGHDGWVIW